MFGFSLELSANLPRLIIIHRKHRRCDGMLSFPLLPKAFLAAQSIAVCRSIITVPCITLSLLICSYEKSGQTNYFAKWKRRLANVLSRKYKKCIASYSSRWLSLVIVSERISSVNVVCMIWVKTFHPCRLTAFSVERRQCLTLRSHLGVLLETRRVKLIWLLCCGQEPAQEIIITTCIDFCVSAANASLTMFYPVSSTRVSMDTLQHSFNWQINLKRTHAISDMHVLISSFVPSISFDNI